MANKLPSREDLFKTFDSVDSPADYSKAVGSLMLENQKTSSRLKRWSLLFLIILLFLAALAAAAFQSLYQNYRSDQIVAEIKKDPLGDIKVDSKDIAVNSIDFNQLNSALKARIVNIDNSVTNLGGQVASANESIENQPVDAGGTVTNVDTGAGLNGGPITTTGLIAIRAPTCTANQRLSWDGANFRCVGVLGTGTVGANTFFAGPASGSGAPSYRTIVAGDLSGAISSTGPVVYNDTTGDISCPTCLTSVGTAFVASADSGSDQSLNIGDTLSLLGGDGISTVASIGNEVTFNLTDTGITPATYGSASSVPTFTVDSKGRLTSASSTAIAINASAITAGTLSVTRGGTGVNGSGATNGQLLIGNGSGYSLSTLTGSGPVGITNSAGGIAIGCSTCVTTSGNGNITSTGGDITLGGTTTGRLIGAGNVNYDLSTTGVTGATYGSANQVGVFTVDSKGRLTGASNTTISGLTSSNLSGTAAITNAQLQNSALTISSGNGLSGGGSVSLGGSSSLAISAPTCLANERLSWNGSAFICSTVAAGGSEAANTFFAGPTSGGAAAPAFRGIVTADLGTGTAND